MIACAVITEVKILVKYMYRFGKIKMTFILHNFICLELHNIRVALYK